jgi:hypothetical protein
MRKVWLTWFDAMECYSGASSLTRRVTGLMACGHRGCLLVTRTVREEASVHGPATYSTLDMIGNDDHPKLLEGWFMVATTKKFSFFLPISPNRIFRRT